MSVLGQCYNMDEHDMDEDDTWYDMDERDDEFQHQHHCCVFSFRQRRTSETVVSPICPAKVKIITKFLRVFE